MKVAIVSNGTISDYEKIEKIISQEYDFIIAVDGGSHHIQKMRLTPSMIVGDLDSVTEETLDYFIEKGVEVKKFPKEKDATDTQLAIDIAIKRGAKWVGLFGCTGSRLDHTLSNIYHLHYLKEKQTRGKLIDDYNILFLADEETEVVSKKGDTVSLIPLTQRVKGVTLEGFKYPLNDATLVRGDSLGVSNELLRDRGLIFKGSGELLVILTCE